MSSFIIKGAKVIDPRGPYHKQIIDLYVHEGIIQQAGRLENTPKEAEVIEAPDMHISPGWVDMRANFWDPGLEHKEDLWTGMTAAAYGGITTVALLPDTEPRLTHKTQIEYIRKRAVNHPVELLPWAGFSADKDGHELSEMYDLAAAGAVGFSSGAKNIQDHAFLMQGLFYAGSLNKPIMLLPENRKIAGKGQINEGLMSVQLGMVGVPVLAEEMEINDIISLVRYTGTPVHLSCISSKKGISLIERAQAEGLPVTADISIQHLSFTEDDLFNFDTNLKLRPPLRTAADRDALRQVLISNPSFCVVSDHTPQEEDRKRCEFELAAHGASSIQTFFSALLSIFGTEQLDLIVELLSYRPRQVLKLGDTTIAPGNQANLTLFAPGATWELNAQTNRSKSRNNPFMFRPLQGKALGIINKGQLLKLY